MSSSFAPRAISAPSNLSSTYHAPAIESVISRADLQREVLYAGTVVLSSPPAIPDPPVSP